MFLTCLDSMATEMLRIVFIMEGIYTCQPPESGQSAERSFDHPPPRQQHEAPLRFGVFTTSRRIPCAAASATGCAPALIRVSQRDRLTGGILHGRRQVGHLGSFLPVGRRDLHSQQISQRIHCRMHTFEPFFRIPPS